MKTELKARLIRDNNNDWIISFDENDNDLPAAYFGEIDVIVVVPASNDIFTRAESAEAALQSVMTRAAQLEADNDDMQDYINEIRVALHTEKDELTIDAVRRIISERGEARKQLEHAQKALHTIEDQASRAALVQDRSVGIIKQTCKIIADTARMAGYDPH